VDQESQGAASYSLLEPEPVQYISVAEPELHGAASFGLLAPKTHQKINLKKKFALPHTV
jgi:hypothetical protein